MVISLSSFKVIHLIKVKVARLQSIPYLLPNILATVAVKRPYSKRRKGILNFEMSFFIIAIGVKLIIFWRYITGARGIRVPEVTPYLGHRSYLTSLPGTRVDGTLLFSPSTIR